MLRSYAVILFWWNDVKIYSHLEYVGRNTHQMFAQYLQNNLFLTKRGMEHNSAASTWSKSLNACRNLVSFSKVDRLTQFNYSFCDNVLN